VVQKSDTLWDLSKKFLGDPFKWPTIWKYNNQPEVVAQTGMKIVNPDLIFVDQVIYIPLKVFTPPMTPPGPTVTGKAPAYTEFQSPAFKYSFEDIPLYSVVSPGFVATIKLLASVEVRSEKKLKIVGLKKDGFDVTARNESTNVFGKLISGIKNWVELRKKRIKIRKYTYTKIH